MTDPISLDDQIKCVRRELALRKNVYPGFVARGKMKQAEADYQLAVMQAVHNTLTIARDMHTALCKVQWGDTNQDWESACPACSTNKRSGDARHAPTCGIALVLEAAEHSGFPKAPA